MQILKPAKSIIGASLALLAVTLVTAPAAVAQTIVLTSGFTQGQTSVVGGNTRYNYSYNITSGSGPAISHFVLQLCDTSLNSLILSSVNFGTAEKRPTGSPDPTTGATGLKVDYSFNDNQTKTLTFSLNQYFALQQSTVTFKSGNEVEVVNVMLPTCAPINNQQAIPEAGTGALAAFPALVALAGIAVRRRRRA